MRHLSAKEKYVPYNYPPLYPLTWCPVRCGYSFLLFLTEPHQIVRDRRWRTNAWEPLF